MTARRAFLLTLGKIGALMATVPRQLLGQPKRRVTLPPTPEPIETVTFDSMRVGLDVWVMNKGSMSMTPVTAILPAPGGAHDLVTRIDNRTVLVRWSGEQLP